jgi:hypothetical protein
VPPSLPEYLSQSLHFYAINIQEPAQAVPQSLASGWLSIFAAGLFTLLGAFLGAWYGGKAAYLNTIKASSELLKRQKLEEALFVLGNLDSQARQMKIVASDLALHGVSESIVKQWSKAVGGLDHDAIIKFNALLQIYDPPLYERFKSSFDELLRMIWNIEESNCVVSDAHMTLKVFNDFLTVTKDLEGELINKLKLN